MTTGRRISLWALHQCLGEIFFLSGISVQPQPDEDHYPDPSWYHPSRPVLRRLFAVLHGQLLSMKILRSHCDPGWQRGAFLSSRSQKGSFSVRVQRRCVIQTKLGQPRGAGRCSRVKASSSFFVFSTCLSVILLWDQACRLLLQVPYIQMCESGF